jgi:exopolyphosphatase/guanosine-5'-triphosphate,3'-diphosphate pyrophosphatase
LEPVQPDEAPEALLGRLGIAVPDAEHAIRCARFAGAIFDGAREQLDLKPSDRRLAVVASLFHDSGYLRGARDHHRKSFDIVLGASIPGFTSQEQTIAACAARYHGRTVPNIEHAGFGEMDTDEQRRTRRLSAIVRLASACDASHLGVITGVSARASGNELVVTATATEEPSVDRDRMREAAGGFQALAYLPVRIEIRVEPA